ncbi:MAG: hypothetical protein AMS22_05105 [Thiotrichales bacterium SG8_50]|nr:MAG: hypothetical protein AMS22_05105 [Thiotrichales bacterium SG8_50]
MEVKTTGTTNTSGYHIRLTDGSGNYKEWHIAGSDTWGGEWKCFVLDVNSTTDVYASSGTLSLSDIDVITWYVDISNSGNIRIIDNQWNDVVRYGTGLTLTGTTFDLADAAAIDESSTYRYGILETKDGVIFCQGKLLIGNGATTTTFQSADETLIFKDRNADGEGQVASGFYTLTFSGSGCTATVNRLVCKGAGSTATTRFSVDASDTNSNVTIDGSTFIRASTCDFASTSEVTSTSFIDCQQVDPSTSTFELCTFRNYVGTTGALLYPSDDSNISDLFFYNCDNGVEYDASSDSTTPTFDNFVFDDEAGNYDVNNTSGSAATIYLVNNASGYANSYNTGGSTVTFVTNPVTTLITVKDATTFGVISGARVLLYAADATGDLNYQESISITSSGTTATVSHTAHGLATDDWVLIEGADQEAYNGAYQITVTGVNGYTYTMTDTATSPATGTITSTTVIFNETTNVSGQVSDTRSLSTDQNVIGKARKSSATPFYRSSPITETISSSTGLSLTVLMIPDE